MKSPWINLCNSEQLVHWMLTLWEGCLAWRVHKSVNKTVTENRDLTASLLRFPSFVLEFTCSRVHTKQFMHYGTHTQTQVWWIFANMSHAHTHTHKQKQTTEVHINLSIFDKRAFYWVTNNMFHFTKPNPSLSTVYIIAKQQQAVKHHITAISTWLPSNRGWTLVK